jgi:hypothetical protein
MIMIPHPNKKVVARKPRSPLSMVSFSEDSDTCLRSFKGDNQACLKSFPKKEKPLKPSNVLKSFDMEAIKRPDTRTFMVEMSASMAEKEHGNKKFWPTSIESSGTGRLRRVVVDHEDVDAIEDFVSGHGGTIQEE